MVLNCAGVVLKRDVTTMFTYSHANTPLGQSERAYYLSYFINEYIRRLYGQYMLINGVRLAHHIFFASEVTCLSYCIFRSSAW